MNRIVSGLVGVALGAAGGIRMADVKFIGYDFARYGSAAERKRLLEKWDRDVYALPR